jgi:hypothetical protein
MAHLMPAASDFGSDGAVAGGGAFELGLGGIFAGEVAEFLVVGSAEGLDAGLVAAFDDPLEVIHPAGGCGLVGLMALCAWSGRTVTAVERPLSFNTRPMRLKWAGSLTSKSGFPRRHSRRFEFFDDGEILFGHVTGPEQEVEADFHCKRCASVGREREVISGGLRLTKSLKCWPRLGPIAG